MSSQKDWKQNTAPAAEELAADRAAAELQRKKRRNRRVRRILILAVLILCAALIYAVLQKKKEEEAAAQTDTTLELADGEELVYGRITSIVGNDMEISVLEANQSSPEKEGIGENGSADALQTYTDTGETREYEIPVGTDVVTSLGAVTTFSKLSEGDVIGIVAKSGTDNILRIRILQ